MSVKYQGRTSGELLAESIPLNDRKFGAAPGIEEGKGPDMLRMALLTPVYGSSVVQAALELRSDIRTRIAGDMPDIGVAAAQIADLIRIRQLTGSDLAFPVKGFEAPVGRDTNFTTRTGLFVTSRGIEYGTSDNTQVAPCSFEAQRMPIKTPVTWVARGEHFNTLRHAVAQTIEEVARELERFQPAKSA